MLKKPRKDNCDGREVANNGTKTTPKTNNKVSRNKTVRTVQVTNICYCCYHHQYHNQFVFLPHDASVTTNHHTIAPMFVCPSVRLRWACNVIIRCMLVQIYVYGWIVQCSGHFDTKACPPTISRLSPVLAGREGRHECAN